MTEEIVLRLIIPSIPWNTLANTVIQRSTPVLAAIGLTLLTSLSAFIYIFKKSESEPESEYLFFIAFLAVPYALTLEAIDRYAGYETIRKEEKNSLEKRANQLDQIYSREEKGDEQK